MVVTGQTMIRLNKHLVGILVVVESGILFLSL